MHDRMILIGSKKVLWFIITQSILILTIIGFFIKVDYDLNKLNYFKVPPNLAYYIVSDDGSRIREYYVKSYELEGSRIIIDGFMEKGKDSQPQQVRKSVDGNILVFNKAGILVYKDLFKK